MKRKRSQVGAAALAVSILIHVGVVYAMAERSIKPSGLAERNRITAHLQFRKTPPPPEEAKVEIPAPKPPPVPKPKPKPRQVEKRETPPERPKPERPRPEPEFIPPPPSQVAALDPGPRQDLEEERARREREKYFTEIMNKIEGMKYYPLAARRRGIQDTVRIEFNVSADGTVEMLEVSGETRILNQAAKEAVIKSSPLPPPPGAHGSSMKVEIAMKFALE
ncbi:MAG: TonB family protein [Nitrospinota bacterium]|nr:TonB family protein [Nitrospinota bacterium]